MQPSGLNHIYNRYTPHFRDTLLLSKGKDICLYICLLLTVLVAFPTHVYSQTAEVDTAATTVVMDTSTAVEDSVPPAPVEPFRNRIGIRTNVADWVATIPNIGFEYEVKRSPYYKNPYTLGGVIRWNWNTWSKYTPSAVFNLFDIRIEGRKYWNTYNDANKVKRLKTSNSPNNPERMRDSRYEITTKEYANGGLAVKTDTVDYWEYLYRQFGKIDRAEANVERGYYFGFYMGYHNYSYKLGSTGRQGNAFSVGITGGYTIPLYSYDNRYIDLDLGGSLGIFYTKYDEYRHDPESNCYPIVAANQGAIFPMVTELRLALVYRFQSVRQKTLTDKQGRSARLDYLDELKLKMGKINDSIMQVRQLRADSIKLAKQNAKLERALQDSLQKARNAFVKDSIKQAKLHAQLMADSLTRLRVMLVDSGYSIDSLGIDTLTDVNEAVRRAALTLGIIQPEPEPVVEEVVEEEVESTESPVKDMEPLWVEDWKTMKLLNPPATEEAAPADAEETPPATDGSSPANAPPAEDAPPGDNAGPQ